jgi:hypothetical protein
MAIAWPSFELSAGMEMAATGIDEVCSIKVARRRILGWIRSKMGVLEKLLGKATDLLRRRSEVCWKKRPRVFRASREHTKRVEVTNRKKEIMDK